MFKVCLNSLKPKLNDYFGRRALLAPSVLKSFVLHKDKYIHFCLNTFPFEEEISMIVNKIISQKAEIIFFSSYVWNINKIKEICLLLKNRINTIIAVGGPEITHIEKESLFKNNIIDFVIIGEGEEALYSLIAKIKKKQNDFFKIPNIVFKQNNEIINTSFKLLDISKHDYPLIIDSLNEYSRVCYETSRGCIWKCKFCLWHKGKGKLRYYPINKVKNDLVIIFKSHGIEMLEIVDADINMNINRAIEIFKHIRNLNDKREKEGLNRVYLQIETNPQILHNDVIVELVKHDRILDFGLQTINENLNMSLGRVYTKDIYFKKLNLIVNKESDKFSEHMLEIIYGLPDDNLIGFINTIKYILDLPYEIYFWSFRLLVMPGTYFYEKAHELKILFNNNPPYQVMRTATWSNNDLNKARELSFYFFLIQFCFPSIFNLVKFHFRGDRFKMFYDLFEYYRSEYKELSSLETKIGEETYQFQKCRSFISAPANKLLIKKILMESERFIKNNAQRN